MDLVDLPCDLCGVKNEEFLYAKNGALTGHPFNLVRCRGCGFLYINPRLSEAALAALYDDDYYTGKGFDGGIRYATHGEGGERAAEWSLGIIQELAPAPARLLDYGCGVGKLVEAANRAGYQAEGFDVSRSAFAAAAPGREKIYTAEADIPAQSYDVVSAVEVLEHVYSPREALRKILSYLKPGGLFYYQTGIFDTYYDEWRRGGKTIDLDSYIVPEGHVNFFSTSVMEKYLKQAGFSTLVRFRRKNYIKSGRWFSLLARSRLIDPAQNRPRTLFEKTLYYGGQKLLRGVKPGQRFLPYAKK